MKIGIITGNSYGEHMNLRIKGFRQALENRRDTEIVATLESKINKLEAIHQTFRMLNEHPEINVIFGVSATDGPGIVQALDNYFPGRQVTVIAFDALPETVELLKENKIKAFIAQSSYQIGYESIELMRKALDGQSIPSVTYTDAVIVDKSSLDEYLVKVERRN